MAGEEDIYKLDMIIGKSDADITIIDYSSLTCPHCATFHAEVFPKLNEEYIETGKAKLIFFSNDTNISSLLKIWNLNKSFRYERLFQGL